MLRPKDCDGRINSEGKAFDGMGTDTSRYRISFIEVSNVLTPALHIVTFAPKTVGLVAVARFVSVVEGGCK